MGEVIPFPSRNVAEAPVATAARRRPPATVFQDRGWRILELPSCGQYLAVSSYCRRGIVVGRFAPQAAAENRHEGTEIAILTRCGGDEKLARCTIAWLNSGGPQTAILSSFVVAAGGRYRYWRDAIVEVAAIGGTRLARLLDGSIAIAREPEPVPLLDLFAPVKENRCRAAFNRLPRDMRTAILRWADPRAQFGDWSDPAVRL
ncbi:MAG TPA: hypothetical protein VHT52_14645 [Stellaceae bacterium]|jgi:hypothetical protein|nr:hypothetical protein [Stellaceae bacterium]